MTVVILFCHWLGGRMRGVLIGVLAGAFSATVAAGFALWAEILRPEQLLAQPFSWQQIVFLMSWFMGVVAYAIGQTKPPELLLSVAALACTFSGILIAIVLRELVLRGNLQIEYLGFGLLSLLVMATLLWAILVINFDKLPQHFHTAWSVASPFFLTFFISLFSTLLFADHLAAAWNALGAPHWHVFLSTTSHTGLAGDDDIRSLYDRAVSLLPMVQTPLQILTVVVVVYVVSDKLDEMIRYMQLTSDEIAVAHKLRSPARKAIHDSRLLDALYPKKFLIDMKDDPLQWPSMAGVTEPAIVSVHISRGAPTGYADQLQRMLSGANVSLSRSVFLICDELDRRPGDNESGRKIIAYGTGDEWRTLMDDPAFVYILALGAVAPLIGYIDGRRAGMIGDNAEREPLLNTLSFDADRRLADLLAHMSGSGAVTVPSRTKRVLLTSCKTPDAVAILGLDDITQYLYH
jgi:hypothetical protein